MRVPVFVMPVVVVSGVLLMPAASAETLFVKGTEVNLRKKPKRGTAVAGKVVIGDACEVTGRKKRGWIGLKCGEIVGFTKESLLTKVELTTEECDRRAQDGALSPTERFAWVSRALALDKKAGRKSKPELLQRARSLFFDAEFSVLEDFRKANKSLSEKHERGCGKSDRTEDCLAKLIETAPFDWHALVVRKGSFVSAFHTNDKLTVLSGRAVRIARGQSKLLQVELQRRAHYSLSSELVAALSSKKRKRPPKYQLNARGKVLDSKSLKALRAVPPRWRQLSGAPGERFHQKECFAGIPMMHLIFDMHGRVYFYEFLGQDGGDIPIKHAKRSQGVLQIELEVPTGLAPNTTVKLRYPTKERNVAFLGKTAFARMLDGTDRTPFKTNEPAEECGEP